jgi:hypothetical protein
MLQVPPAIIHQYNLHQMHARMLELLARQFPNSYAIAPVNERGTCSGAELARRRRKPVAEEEYQANVSADAFELRLFSTSAVQVAWSLSTAVAVSSTACLHSCAPVLPSSGGCMVENGCSVNYRASHPCLQVAWSPVWGEAGCRHAMIAVSTKSGRVWLWRYHLPSEYSMTAESGSLSERCALVRKRCLACHLA